MFGGYLGRGDGFDADGDEEWPPFRKVGDFVCTLQKCSLLGMNTAAMAVQPRLIHSDVV